MVEASSDYRVTVTLDRGLLVLDIERLVKILARQRMAIIVSASSMKEAEERAREHLLRTGISTTYIKALTPRRLP